MTDLDFGVVLDWKKVLYSNKIGYQTNRQERYLLITFDSLQIRNGVDTEIILKTTHTLMERHVNCYRFSSSEDFSYLGQVANRSVTF